MFGLLFNPAGGSLFSFSFHNFCNLLNLKINTKFIIYYKKLLFTIIYKLFFFFYKFSFYPTTTVNYESRHLTTKQTLNSKRATTNTPIICKIYEITKFT